MTAATPTLDPTAEPLLDEPDRRVCELREQDSGAQCKRDAAWILVCDAADCGHFHGPVLVCQPCKNEVLAVETLVMCPERGCLLACYVRLVEAL